MLDDLALVWILPVAIKHRVASELEALNSISILMQGAR